MLIEAVIIFLSIAGLVHADVYEYCVWVSSLPSSVTGEGTVDWGVLKSRGKFNSHQPSQNTRFVAMSTNYYLLVISPASLPEENFLYKCEQKGIIKKLKRHIQAGQGLITEEISPPPWDFTKNDWEVHIST